MKQFLIIIILLISPALVFATEDPRAVNGLIDLSSVDFAGGETADIEGEFNFIWKELRDPSLEEDFKNIEEKRHFPVYWNWAYENDVVYDTDGYATYHVKVILPEPGSTYRLARRLLC